MMDCEPMATSLMNKKLQECVVEQINNIDRLLVFDFVQIFG